MRGVALIWSFLLLTSFYMGSPGHVIPGEEKLVWSQSLYDRPGWVQTLSNWLELAYSEAKDFSGCGDLGPEHLTGVNLYTTYGAVHALHYLGEEVRAPHSIGEYINSLLNAQGAYDCPLNQAPLVIETHWAVTTLHLLGTPPRDPEKTITFLLSLQEPDGLFRFDAELEDRISATWLITETLHLLEYESPLLVRSSLDRAASGLSKVADDLVRQDWHALGTKEANQLESALEVLALLSPERVSDEGKAALAYYLTEIPFMPVDFLGPSRVNNLLDAAEAVGLIRAAEVSDLPGLTLYLQRITSQPEITELGGYGWYCRWAGRVDPVKTWPCVRLFARASLPYPSRDMLMRELDKYRRENGWITITIPCPNVDFTYFGLGIAQAIDWEGYNPEKMLAYARSVLQDPTADVHDLYWAAKLASELGESELRLESMLQTSIGRISESDLEEEMYWLVLILAEFHLSPPSQHAVHLLQECATVLTQAISAMAHIQRIYQLIYIQEVLGQEWLLSEQLEAMVWALKTEEGGFKAFPSAPTADLMSSFWALKALAALDAVDELDAEGLLRFIRSCQTDFGFAWAPSGASEPDFYSTFVGLNIIKFLDSH